MATEAAAEAEALSVVLTRLASTPDDKLEQVCGAQRVA